MGVIMSSISTKNQIFVVLFFLILVYLAEYLSNRVFKFSLITHVESFLILVVLLLIYFSAMGYFTRRKLLENIKVDFDDFKISMQTDIKMLSQSVEKISIDWLKTQNDINNTEKRVTKDMEIWIITPDLKNDTNLKEPEIKEIIEIVRKNMSRGIRYTYIVPDKDPYVRGKIDELIHIFKKHKNSEKLVIKKIDKDNFSLFGNMCFTIYNPRSVNGQPSRVYLELPREEKKWWMELSQTQATIFEGKIAELIEDTK